MCIFTRRTLKVLFGVVVLVVVVCPIAYSHFVFDIRQLQAEFKKYEEAVKLDANDVEAWSNWGLVLSLMAAMTQDPKEKKVLLKAECNKLEEVTKLDKSCANAWAQWGCALGNLAILEQDLENKQALFEKATTCCKQAVALRDNRFVDYHQYDLARVLALSGKLDEAFKELADCLERKEIPWSQVAEDSDWDAVRNDERYLALETKYGK